MARSSLSGNACGPGWRCAPSWSRAAGIVNCSTTAQHPPRVGLTFSGADLAALQAGRRLEGSYDALAWGELIDAYVLLANEGEALVRAVAGATGPTVLTGGGLRSRRWREAKVALGPDRIEVSTVTEAATRGSAAIAGANLGWWPTPEEMPGTTRTPVTSAVEMEQVASALTW